MWGAASIHYVDDSQKCLLEFFQIFFLFCGRRGRVLQMYSTLCLSLDLEVSAHISASLSDLAMRVVKGKGGRAVVVIPRMS